MKSLILLLIVGLLGWQAYQVPKKHATYEETTEQVESVVSEEVGDEVKDNGRFQCDERRYCSQMKSCEEAQYFLKYCPGVSMDGNHDGVPCEKQWCH